MNNTCLVGRITKDIELRNNDAGIPYTRFTLAVNRDYTDAEGKRPADFISCVAWRKTAELIHEHFKKGSELGIIGRIQTGSYDKQDGSKGYLTDVIVNKIIFVGSKKNGEAPAPEYTGTIETNEGEDPFADVGTQVLTEDDELPF